jgi:hypothetical protein
MVGGLLASRAAWRVMGARVRRRLQKGRLTDMTKERNEHGKGRQRGCEAQDMAKRRRAGWRTHQEHEAEQPRPFLSSLLLPSHRAEADPAWRSPCASESCPTAILVRPLPIYTTLVVVVAEHALLQHLDRLKIKLRLLRSPAWANTVTRFASPLWLWLWLRPQGRARDSTEDIPDRPFTLRSNLETYFRQRGRDAWRRRPPRRHARP